MIIKKLLRKLGPVWWRRPQSDLEAYVRQGRRPWSRGYREYKDHYIAQHLQDVSFLQKFANNEPLPGRYGEFLDERVVEYPWLFSRLAEGPGRILDAGSVLNFPHIIQQPSLGNKKITIVTLAPEGFCFWQQAIAYVYADLRELPFRDAYFDQVICISTLEHVGKDNATYTTDPAFRENKASDFEQAVQELKRVCKKGGRVLISVPFGDFTDFGWYQQFDGPLVDRIIATFAPSRVRETFFRYVDGGWKISDRHGCAGCQGFDIHATKYLNALSTRDYDPDWAAASRSIAALELWKGD